MKKKPQSISSFGPWVTLYRADLAEILAIFTRHCKSVEISDNENEYNDLDDLVTSVGPEITILNIAGSQPYISLSIDKKLHLYAGEAASSPYMQIRLILDRRQRKLLNLLFNPITSVVYAYIFSALTMLLVIRFASRGWPIYSIYLVSLGIIFIAPWLGFAARNGRFSKIYLTNKHERTSFWARNKDNLGMLS